MSELPAGKTILIVDDEPSIVGLLKDILEAAHYNAIGTTRWTEAVEAIGKANPSLILLDLKMPTIDGPSMLEFIRKEGLRVPVIIVSGFITDNVSEELKRLDVEAFIQKPFRAAEILEQVRRVIGAPGTSRPDTERLPQPKGDEADVLAALTRFDNSAPSAAPAQAPAAQAPERDDSDVLKALQRHDRVESTEAPAPGPTRPPSTVPVPPAPTITPHPLAAVRPSPLADALAPPATPSTPSPNFPEALVGSPPESTAPFQDDTRHRRRHHRPTRRWRLTRRTVVLYGGMVMTCVVIASFMALMQWYASQVDIAELQSNVTKSATESIQRKMLEELKAQQK